MNYVEIAELVFKERDETIWADVNITTEEQFDILNQDNNPENESVNHSGDVESTVNHILLIAAMEGEL